MMTGVGLLSSESSTLNNVLLMVPLETHVHAHTYVLEHNSSHDFLRSLGRWRGWLEPSSNGKDLLPLLVTDKYDPSTVLSFINLSVWWKEYINFTVSFNFTCIKMFPMDFGDVLSSAYPFKDFADFSSIPPEPTKNKIDIIIALYLLLLAWSVYEICIWLVVSVCSN